MTFTPKLLSSAVVLTSLMLSTTACQKDKDESARTGEVSQKLVELGLQGTRWEQCSFRYSHTGLDPADGITIYVKELLDFTGPSSGKVVAQFFAKDKDCTEVVSLEEVTSLTKGEIEALEPSEKDELTLEVGPPSANGETFDLDIIFPKESEYNSFHVAKISDDTLEISDRCHNEEYVKEGLCKKVDGNSPDNRATSFGMFGENERNIFTKMK